MTQQETHSNVQAVRQVDETGHPSSTLSNIIHLVCHSDSIAGRDILLWDDILAVFKNALYVRSGTVALPFLKGNDFKNLDPLRIAAVSGVTLDIVVRSQMGEKELSIAGLQEALPDTPQENNSANSSSTLNIATITTNATVRRRNPVGGLVEEAMDAYRNNENPAFGPKLRGPQAIIETPSLTPPPSLQSSSNTSSPSPDKSPTLQTPKRPDPMLSYFKGANAEILAKAMLGHKDAQFAVGNLYKDGQGSIPQDYQNAIMWYLKAANQGHIDAQDILGYLYDRVRGVPRDFAQAMKWYRKAAEQGHIEALYSVGLMYAEGRGVPKDREQARVWLRRAVEKGHLQAQAIIDNLYPDNVSGH
ncbi:hypothetical protein EC991_007642 [Linnemannia zychae]|nr:hypothetical protein EC991_007642 [Linnemannia zychae]